MAGVSKCAVSVVGISTRKHSNQEILCALGLYDLYPLHNLLFCSEIYKIKNVDHILANFKLRASLHIFKVFSLLILLYFTNHFS